MKSEQLELRRTAHWDELPVAQESCLVLFFRKWQVTIQLLANRRHDGDRGPAHDGFLGKSHHADFDVLVPAQVRNQGSPIPGWSPSQPLRSIDDQECGDYNTAAPARIKLRILISAPIRQRWCCNGPRLPPAISCILSGTGGCVATLKQLRLETNFDSRGGGDLQPQRPGRW